MTDTATEEHSERPSRQYIDDCLTRRILFFTGKGGVGKSTVAWATALACQRRGARVAVVSWNPLEPYAKPIPGERSGIDWVPLETLACFREYVVKMFKFETVYHMVFDNHVLKTFVRATPGLSETVISGKVWDLYDRGEYDLIVVDLPSSGHAVSFFSSPLGVHKVFAIGFVHKEAGKICDMFRSSEARVDLVALPEELPLVEGLQLKEKLQSLLPFHFGFLHLNQCTPNLRPPSPEALEKYPEAVRAVCAGHLERREMEQETSEWVTRFHLPTHRLPRFPSGSMEETLLKASEFLERV